MKKIFDIKIEQSDDIELKGTSEGDLLVSVNSNGSLIDRDWLEFFRHEPPFRFNITLYGGSEATYERLFMDSNFLSTLRAMM